MYNLPKVKIEIERRRALVAKENIIDSKQIITRLSKVFNGELSSQLLSHQGQKVHIILVCI